MIVARVAEGHQIRLQADARPLEKPMARGTSGILGRAVLAPRPRRDVFALHAQRPPERCREVGAESLVRIRGATQLMIEMGESSRPQFARRVERADEMRERDRVRSARDGGDDAYLRRPQLMPCRKSTDAIDQSQTLNCRLFDCRLDIGAGGRTRTADPALMRRVL